MTLSELVEASGVPARTIRFYISRGLMSGPLKAGRGAEYTPAHLERLERIKSLQAEGRTLSEMAPLLEPAAAATETASVAWRHYALGDDVVIQVRADLSPWRTRQIRAAIDEFARRIQTSGQGPEEE
ncbi:MAG: MerR family transcriptional regulator [Acidobacteria bacterium]|nr:MerR family transcriptional regulator [Acidobacteriota bacterium]